MVRGCLLLFCVASSAAWASGKTVGVTEVDARLAEAAAVEKAAEARASSGTTAASSQEVAATCSCGGRGDCTCKKGQCKCKNCHHHRLQLKPVYERLDGATQTGQVPNTAVQRDARAGSFI